jgi:hypothetical protein
MQRRMVGWWIMIWKRSVRKRSLLSEVLSRSRFEPGVFQLQTFSFPRLCKFCLRQTVCTSLAHMVCPRWAVPPGGRPTGGGLSVRCGAHQRWPLDPASVPTIGADREDISTGQFPRLQAGWAGHVKQGMYEKYWYGHLACVYDWILCCP